MSSASSSGSGRRRSPRLEKKSVNRSAQAQSGYGWSPESLYQEEDDDSHPREQEPLPIAKVVLKKMSNEEIAQVTGRESGLRGNSSNQRNTGESASVLDVSVIELDREDQEDQEDHHQLADGPQALIESDVSSEGPLPNMPGPSSTQTYRVFGMYMEDLRRRISDFEEIITIDDEEEQDQSAEDDVMILRDQADPQVLDNSASLNDGFSAVDRSLNEASGSTLHTPSQNRSNTTIDLTRSDSPLTDKVKAAGSSSTGGAALEVSQDTPSHEPHCPICLESYVTLVKGNVKLLSLVCGHMSCGPCLQESLKRRPACPICRAEVRRGEPRKVIF